MKRIAAVIALSIGFASTAAVAQSNDEDLQPGFKRAQIVSNQDAIQPAQQEAANQVKSPYSYLTETSPN